jgi:hypothetical protein
MFHLYKIIFPECCKLYIGSTGMTHRYGGKNKFGEQFVGEHHNPEVQNILNQGFFGVWVLLKSTSSETEVKKWETDYLKKVWDGESFKSRPKWLLNRTTETKGTPTGFKHGENYYTYAPGYVNPRSGENHYTQREDWDPGSHWTKQLENKEKLLQTLEAAKSPESILKRKQTRKQTESDPNYVSPLVGRKRPDHSEKMKQKTKCPFCGLLSNKGGLATHIKHRHPENNALK